MPKFFNILPLLSKSSSLLVGLVTILFILLYTTPEFQGFFYAFSSLISLQVFVDMGLYYTLTHISSHEAANLVWDKHGNLCGDISKLKRIRFLFSLSNKWFIYGSLLYIITIFPLGFYYLKLTILDGSYSEVIIPWILASSIILMNFFINGVVSIVEGCNQSINIAIIKALQMLAYGIFLWASLIFDLKLFSIPIALGMSLLIGIFLINRRYGNFLHSIFKIKNPLEFKVWKIEIYKFHSKIAVSWISGYLIFQLFTPIILYANGPIIAGQFGMTLQIISAINSLSIVIMLSKIPDFSRLIVKDNYHELRELYLKNLYFSSAVFIFIAISVLILIYFGDILYPNVFNRILDINLIIFFLVAAFLNHITFSQATLLRSFKEEPYMKISLLGGIITAISLFLIVPKFGYEYAVYIYFFNSFVTLMLSINLYNNKMELLS